MRRRLLHDGWTVSAVDGPVPAGIMSEGDGGWPAAVPGVVHLDLLAGGAIPDPYLGSAESELQWIGRTTWRYVTRFEWEDDGSARHDLVFDGLDTLATVSLNGVELGRTRNQHRVYRFDARVALHPGSNELSVEFASALDYAEAMVDELGRRPQVYPHPFAMIRKSACNFGWDWGPDVVTAGIWRPVALESWSGVRLAAVRPTTPANGRVRVAVELERAEDGDDPVEVRCRVADAVGTVTVTGARADFALEVDSPALWWPVGYGAQPLHDLVVEAGEDSAVQRVGFRTVTIEHEPDDHGIPFDLRVNGRSVAVRGANWIPDDAFPSRVDRDRYAARLDDALEANMNLLRVWGGGIYESDDFYELCDERGLLVWQDFLFACAAYPEEEPLHSEVAAEARDAIDRLASHPSLALWNGANENIWGHVDWGWIDELEGRTWGEGYYLDLLPGLVAELNPARPYIPNSPFSWDPSHHPNDPSDALVHIWDVWNDLDYTVYADYRARFVSEFGFQGPPAWSTLVRSVGDEPLRPDGPELMVHQKAEDGQGKLSRGFAPHLPPPRDFDAWHWTTQLNQARAMRFGVEHFRADHPRCRGTIVWQLNDCWPVVSWAAVDGDGIRKPLWHALRAAYSDRLLVVGDDRLTVVNDSDSAWNAEVELSRWDLDGSAPRERVTLSATVAARSAEATLLPEPFRRQSAGDLTAARCEGAEGGIRMRREYVESGLPTAQLDAEVVTRAGVIEVRVTAQSLVLDLTLLVDRIDPHAVVDNGMRTLLRGESAVFTVRGVAAEEAGMLVRPPVLRTANSLFDS